MSTVNHNLHAGLTRDEERAIDRTIMNQEAAWRDATMGYKELAEHYKQHCEWITNRSNAIEAENVVLRRELSELKAKIDRYYKEILK